MFFESAAPSGVALEEAPEREYHSRVVPFWPTLWPNLIATIVGVAIGVPIALFLNRKAETASGRRAEDARKAAFGRVAESLRSSITWNGEKAEMLAENISRGGVPIMVPLETERWDAMKVEFARVAHESELQWRVAYFFGMVARTRALAAQWFEFKFGPSSATELAPEVDRALRGQLLEDLPGIAHEAHELDGLLKELP